MRVLIAALGSRGDVQPVLALALALRARGHDATVYAPPDFESWSREIGVPFLSSARSAQEVLTEHAAAMGSHPVRVMRLIKAIIAREVPGWFERTLEAARACDVIVTANQFAAQSVAEKLGIPCVTVMYSPTMLRSAYHPPLVARAQEMPRWLNALTWKLSNAVVHRMLAEPINSAREAGIAARRFRAEALVRGTPDLAGVRSRRGSGAARLVCVQGHRDGTVVL